MGFGKAFSAGKRYEDYHVTARRGRVAPDRGADGSIVQQGGFEKILHIENVVAKKSFWKRKTKTASALRCLLINAKNVPALAKLGQAALVELSEAMRRVPCGSGDVIIRQHDEGDFFYIVELGKFEATQEGGTKVLKQYGPGGYFGELALLRNAPRAATVICLADDSMLWALDRATFRRNVMSVRLRRSALDVPYLANLSHAQLEEIADAMFEVRCAAGEVLITQGEEGDNFYLVEDGRFEATVASDALDVTDGAYGADVAAQQATRPHASTEAMVVASFQQGDFFGERALMQNLPRSATVTCIAEGRVWALDRHSFREIALGMGVVHFHTDLGEEGEAIEEAGGDGDDDEKSDDEEGTAGQGQDGVGAAAAASSGAGADGAVDLHEAGAVLGTPLRQHRSASSTSAVSPRTPRTPKKVIEAVRSKLSKLVDVSRVHSRLSAHYRYAVEFETAEEKRLRKRLRYNPKLQMLFGRIWEAADTYFSRMYLNSYMDYHLSVHRFILEVAMLLMLCDHLITPSACSAARSSNACHLL